MGSIAFTAYICSLGFYLWIRITKTLDLGPYLWYGCLILSIEMLGATTVILYGLNLVSPPCRRLTSSQSVIILLHTVA